MKKKKNLNQSFAKVFFPLQYLAIHILFFGFVFEPINIIPKIVTVFHWDEIVSALAKFTDVFVAGLTVKSVFTIIVYAIPYTANLLWSLKYLLIYLLVLIQLIHFIVCLARARKHRKKINLNKQVQLHNGAPGTGKSWMLVLFSQILSRLMWNKLSWLYWRDKEKVNQWQAENNAQKFEDWYEVEESYKYYKTPQDGVLPIKCLFSNIGIEQDGRFSSELTFEHAAQLERVPSYTISLYSEFGTTYNIEYSQQKLLQMSDDLRFCRQFRENVILGDEQDATNVAIDARRVVSDVFLMKDCKIILKPLLLNIVFKPLKWFFSRTQKFSKSWSGVMTKFEQLISCIGFVKFKYDIEGNTEHQRTRGRGVFISPLWNSIKYDTRAFRKLSDCRNKPFKAKIHTSLVVAPTSENRQAYLRAEFKNRPEVFFTNTNTLEMLKKEKEFWDIEFLKEKLNTWREDYPEKHTIFKEKYSHLLLLAEKNIVQQEAVCDAKSTRVDSVTDPPHNSTG